MPEVSWRSPYKGLRVVLPAAPADAAAAAAAAELLAALEAASGEDLHKYLA